MKRRLGLVRWAVVAALSVQAIGQQASPGAPAFKRAVTVDEAAARAVLTQNSVRVHLPLHAAATPATRASAWLLSSENLASGIVVTDLPVGARAIDLTLPLPRDKSGSLKSDIGWYRIAYRLGGVDQAAPQGILSIGAIAPNLLELHLARTEQVMPGKPLSVRVYACNPVTRRPFRNVDLTATLEYDDPASKAARRPKIRVVRTARSDGTGEALLTFPMPSLPGTDGTITVVGSLVDQAGNKTTASIDSDITVFSQAIAQVETDKPLHKPGETVHLRALLFDGAGRALNKTPLTMTILDPQQKTLLETSVETNRFGIASYDWKTDPHLATGEYMARITSDDSSNWAVLGSASLTIKRYDLPEFTVTAAMDKGYYTEGQTPMVHLHAGYLFGKALAQGQVRVARSKNRWSPDEDDKPEPEKTASLDANGDATISLDASRNFAELRKNDYERYVDVRYHAVVTDMTTGRSEPRNFTVRLTRYPVHIYLNKLGGDDREGDYIVTASYADGLPVSCRIALDWLGRDSAPRGHAVTVTTNRYGAAKVRLRYPTGDGIKDRWGDIGLRLTAKDPEGRTSIEDERASVGDAGDVWLEVRHSLLKPNQPIEAVVHAKAGSTVDVDVISDHGLLDHERIHMGHGSEEMTISADASFHGLVTLWAYELQGEKTQRRYRSGSDESYKSVLYPEDNELKVKVSGIAQSYAPGALVNASLQVRGPNSGVSGAFGVSVFDEGVEQRAQTEDEQNQPWYGGWWESGTNIGGVSLASLNRTDLTQAIPDDLDLAAEAVLEFASHLLRGSIESEDSSGERESYDQMMHKTLEPVGRAILQAFPARLPETTADIEGITQAAGLADNLLLDPWNTPYRAQDVLGEDEALSFTSAGPDKQFGTDDDFTIEVARRSLFMVPGARLMEILNGTAQSGMPLPASVDALKSTALAAGLDLDTVLDPDGKPYSYKLAVAGRGYMVQVFRQDAEETDPTNRWPLWTSPGVDYFRPMEQRMQSALDAWTNGGHTFPNTEAEAKTAFTAAGIDVDSLRDPLGGKLQLVVTRVSLYTESEHIAAAGSGVASASSKPVTRLMRAIQIVQPADPSTQPATLVAQMLHPITEQSGRDLVPMAVDEGMFSGNTGAIGGTVTDPKDAAIAKATVTIKNAEGSATVETVQTTEDGRYLAKNLASGTYMVEFSSEGFQSSVVNDVAVHIYALTTVDMKLNIGSVAETVTVSAQAGSALATENASMSVSKLAQGTSAEARANSPGQQFTPRLRHVFAETAFWAPSLETSPNGRAGIQFHLPDSLTTWKLHALASTVDGRVLSVDQTFRTFQPFFVDFDVPQVLTVGDELQLPATLRNYTQHDIDLPVKAEASDAVRLTTASTVQAHIAANGSASSVFGLRAAAPVMAAPARITAADTHVGDAVEKTIRVHPDGEPLSLASSSLLRGKETRLVLDLPADTIRGSAHVTLLLYPNLGSQVIHAMKAALERPYGCAEQTLSSTYPSLLYLELANAAKSGSVKLDAGLEGEAKDYLQLGYTRLKDYFDASGGLTYWGDNDHSPDAALTAYGIEFLTEAAPYLDVDRHQIYDAMGWLARDQQADGSWKPRYGEIRAAETLYIAAALSAGLEDKDVPQDLRKRITEAIARANAWAGSSAAALHDPYANALRLMQTKNSAALRAELAASAVRDKDGLHWSENTYSPFYGWGRAGDIETTAMVLHALEQTGAPDNKLEDDALLYLLHTKDQYGVWMSGQATVRVLKALLPRASAQLRSNPQVQQLSLSVNGKALTGSDATALELDPKILDAPRSLDLSTQLKPGHNELLFAGMDEEGLAGVSTAAEVYVPWGDRPHEKATGTSKDAGLDFGYACAPAGVTTGTPIECTVDARRFGSQSYGMLLATVGLPPGADLDRVSLSKLMDTGNISRYELEPDRIIFYLWPWRAEGLHFTFRFTPRYAIQAKAAAARLEDYYNPDLNVMLAPQTFVVLSPARN